jgi:hypothetical protein
MVYCLAVSGYPWPNTRYVKGGADAWLGLSYFVIEVLLQRPWVLGLTGLAALALGCLRNVAAVRPLMTAWLLSMVAIALSRELHPGGLFFYYRYFAILDAIPLVCLALSLTALPRRAQRVLVLGPVLGVTVAQWPGLWELQRETEQDIAQLHTKPARYIARTLPASATVLVEGAGAMRYFTPRSMTIVDIVGLNDRDIAHAPDDLAHDCLLARSKPSHAAVPDEWLEVIASAFDVRPLARATDEVHHSGRRVFARHLHVLELRGPTQRLQVACAQRRAQGG